MRRGWWGTRQLERVLESVEKAGAKVVLVGDPEQLQAIEAGAPFRGIAAEAGVVELNEVRRQRQDWQKAATRQLATGRTREALDAYEHEQRVRASPTRAEARESMLTAWRRGNSERPNESRLMLAYTRDDVQALNARARELRHDAGELGKSEVIKTERGEREFAVGDRLYFLRNERSLGVKNGSLGTVEDIRGGVLQVRMDGEESRRVTVDSRYYDHLEHGYAATVHKSQGTTVDRTYVLATPHFDRHSTYVALSRHREAAAVFYGREDFEPAWSRASAEENFRNVLSRARPKELAHDYLERDPASESRSQIPFAPPVEQEGAMAAPPRLTAVERLRRSADQVAQRLAAEREKERAAEALVQQRAQARYREQTLGLEKAKERGLARERDPGLEL
jgi:Ti-type conjugative transfer relaxase TraA